MSKHRAFKNANVSVTTQIFYILLALATEEKHGYEIMKQVAKDSGGKVRLGPGTLYGAIKRMLDAGMVVEIAAKPGEDERRRYYRLTEAGRGLFDAELRRYTEAVKIAQERRLSDGLSVANLIYV